ncbi:hypothetical protein [Vibrio phage LP.1]|nr:hypothetical protein [Vibrio phage LP.1]
MSEWIIVLCVVAYFWMGLGLYQLLRDADQSEGVPIGAAVALWPIFLGFMAFL